MVSQFLDIPYVFKNYFFSLQISVCNIFLDIFSSSLGLSLGVLRRQMSPLKAFVSLVFVFSIFLIVRVFLFCVQYSSYTLSAFSIKRPQHVDHGYFQFPAW